MLILTTMLNITHRSRFKREHELPRERKI